MRLRKTLTNWRICRLMSLSSRACVGKVKLACGAAGKSVGDQRAFIRPPTVNRGFPDGGAIRNVFDREVGKAVFARIFRVLRRMA